MSAHSTQAKIALMVRNLRAINHNSTVMVWFMVGSFPTIKGEMEAILFALKSSNKIHLHKAGNLSNLIPGFSSPLSKGTAALYRTITRYKAFFMPVILWRGVVGHLRMRRSFARSANPLHHAAQRLAALCGFYNLSKGA
jgi:hypothetical protein